MTDVATDSEELLPLKVGELIELLNYRGKPDTEIRFGPEIEVFFGMDTDGTVMPLNADDNFTLRNIYAAHIGAPPDVEGSTCCIEFKDGPMALEDIPARLDILNDNIADLMERAKESNIHGLPFSQAFHITRGQIFENGKPGICLTDMPRYKIVIPAFVKLFNPDDVLYGGTTAGIHGSLMYRNTTEMYDNVRRLYYLSPLISALADNSVAFWQHDMPKKGNLRYALTEASRCNPQTRTGIDPLFFVATGADDFLEKYVSRILHAPMVAYYPKKQDAHHTPPLTPFKNNNYQSFAQLAEQDLNTLTNWRFAASCFWHSAKLPEVPVKCDNGYNARRFENRLWPTGVWQLKPALLTQGLMSTDEQCAAEVDALLEEFGFMKCGPGVDKQSGEYLKAAREASLNAENQGLDFQYGKYNARIFSRKLMEILNAAAARYDLQEHLGAMNHIAQTGRTDRIVLSEFYPTREDVYQLVNYLDPAVFTMGLSMDQLHQQGLLPKIEPGRTNSLEQNYG